ncbi:hypothetical protein Pmar_PMAR013133 [Perkinsus marinus ATCC 50983]|uniref:Uncharacterized protein n=1 Tax=Perkinsus marinus (strain ATCC 50983 / TXsc) TaxID=423536 RepID=C5L4Z9_PERM5|nr:hypothetical protein Pmar_PMAR013133 [Perkinsus marinus ATCC 50983]EER08219.1 hypothetical protein Pmar_PMAR013133 [Perkinsus marinus ATCC 50983]|eukprot:XP_002776403.1 hypothetical protein Pmar_PMAR013133 [Perkinsus marinus ATCC 50983]
MSQDESPYWDSHEQEEVPFYQRPAFRTIASIWAVLFFGMLFVNWLVQSIVKGSQTASIDREVLSALQAAVYEVVKDQKDLVSRVDDQYLDLLSRINDLSTGVRRMGHALREPLSLERLQGIVQVPREENRSTMVFCVVSIVLAVLMHYIVLRKDEGQDMRRIRERCGSPRRCQQAVLQCGVMNPPPAYNPEVVPIAAWRDAPMMPVTPRARKAVVAARKADVKEHRLSACVVCMASTSTHAIALQSPPRSHVGTGVAVASAIQD